MVHTWTSNLPLFLIALKREQKEREKQQKLEQEKEEKRRRQQEEEKKRREEEEKRRKAEKEKADKEKAAKKVNALKCCVKKHVEIKRAVSVVCRLYQYEKKYWPILNIYTN